MRVPCDSLVMLALWAGPGAALAAEAETMAVLYPVPYVVVQRDTPTAGQLPIRGRYPPATAPERIEARFCGREWQVLDPQPQGGTFSGSIREAVGQGNLEVRAGGAPELLATVPCVGIGDLFLVTGQSNADGRGDARIALLDSNPFVGVKYRQGQWSPGDDPSANDGDHGSPWPMVLNELIPAEQVPIGYIQAAMGSTVVRQWRRVEGATAENAWAPGGMYARMLAMVSAATDGSMRVRAALYYQGENDLTHWNQLTVLGHHDEYLQHLRAAVTDFHRDLQCPILVGQLTNLGAERDLNDNLRRAQQEVWAELPQALPGAVVYDIYPSDGCHYRTEANLRAFARRWTMAILAGVYGKADFANPALVRAVRVDPTTIRLDFSRNLVVETWDGTAGPKALGFSFRDGPSSLSDQDVGAATVNGREVTLTLARPVGDGALLYYGSGSDGQNQPTLRDAVTKQPVRMVFGAALARP